MFSTNIKILKYKEKRILLNTSNGLWIRVSKRVCDILDLAEKEGYTFQQLLDSLYDDEDRQYMKSVFEKMQKIGLVETSANRIIEKRMILFEVTRRCNLHCTHCCVEAEKEADYEMNHEEIMETLGKILVWNPKQISLTGGEPLMRGDIFVILRFLNKQYAGRITLSTNGTLINEKNVDDLIRYVDQVDISMDGVDEETCSRIRGKGVFQKVMQTIRLLHQKGYYSITLSMISDKFHGKMEKEFYKLNEELGTTPLVRSFTPSGRGKESFGFLGNDKFYSPVPTINKEVMQACSCKAGEEKFLIDYKGNIYPCQYFVKEEFCMGNILKDSIFPIKTDSYMDKIRDYFPQNYKRCNTCPVNYFCWPCPGELYLYSDEDKFDYFKKICEFQRKFLYKKIWDEEVPE